MIWARWCPPCRDKLPLMRRLAAQQKERGYRFVSIAVQLPDLPELNALKGFIYEHKIEWPVYLFDDPKYVELDAHLRAQGGRGLVIPTLFVTDRSGKVLQVLEGQDIDRVGRSDCTGGAVPCGPLQELAGPSPLPRLPAQESLPSDRDLPCEAALKHLKRGPQGSAPPVSAFCS